MSTRKNHSNGEKFKVIFFFLFKFQKYIPSRQPKLNSFIWVIGARSLDTRKGYLYPKIFFFVFLEIR